MRKLYLECNTGISGDMIVASLLDAGASEEVLKKALSGIKDDSFEIKIGRVKRAGLDCCDFDVVLDKEHENHDHDMNYLYDNEPVHSHGHDHHEHEHSHDHHEHKHSHDHHEHEHSHDHHEHEHSHDHHHDQRNPKDIKQIITSLDMSENAKNIAYSIFDILSEAEAKAHGVPVEEVHFHEVGAIDSIVDIISAAVLLDDLKVEGVIVREIAEGTGHVRCQHGVIPVPVPAVSNIAMAHGLPLKITNRQGEFVTPTGAAFVAAVMTEKELPDIFTIESIGMGAGKRDYNPPSIVRAIVISSDSEISESKIWKLESDIDDSTGEVLGYALERIIEAGAREVHYSPIFMKKNRPGWELTVITDDNHINAIEEIIFRETTTIGIRRQLMERTCMERETKTVSTELGDIVVKACRYKDMVKCYPEYESVKKVAQDKKVSLDEVFRAAISAAKEL